ncbi:DUF2523 family protein, partial [Proteus mirabilis]|uniref:DUF2523 family protein n=1 Tax=Proteus mirabilis TaxID=584 RepID=UPI003978821E
ALYFVVQGFVEILVELLPDSSNLSSLFANLSDGFWYFINLSKYVFEVQTSQSDGSGILLAAKILSDKFNISVGAAGLDNFINIR